MYSKIAVVLYFLICLFQIISCVPRKKETYIVKVQCKTGYVILRGVCRPAYELEEIEPCRYVKGAWSECDPKTNTRARTLTLKKGDQATCEATKTIQKKCKKACRYEKGTWGECNAQSQMTRNDKLKANSDPSCEQNRQITKKCKPKGIKPTKATRRNRQ